MPVIEAQCASILVPHDHRHISQKRAFPRMVGHVDDIAKAAHHEYEKLLGDKFVEIARAEIQGLRDPRKLRVHAR